VAEPAARNVGGSPRELLTGELWAWSPEEGSIGGQKIEQKKKGR